MSGSSLDTWVEGEGDAVASEGERYEVVAPLGEGSMGRVEALRDRRLQRVVARKTLHAAGQRGGFQREARIAAGLEHPGIVPIYDAGESDEGPWYTMRRIEGRSLQEALEGATSLDERLVLLPSFERLCEVLAYVHRQGVVHRDVKPANVLLGPFGEVMLVDFGVAAKVGATDAATAGTPAYMSPEAARGEAPDTSMDVWSLGLVLYELLAGERAYRGRTKDLLHELREGAPGLPVVRGPPELAAIVRKAVAPHSERYPDASALRADIVAYTTGRLVGAHAYTAGELVHRFVEAFRGYLLLGAVAAVIVVAVAGLASVQVRADRDRALAAEAERAHQLALALEARARALGGDPHAVEVARQALRLEPTLPWARGVLSEFANHARARLTASIDAECGGVHLLAPGRLLARCDDTLRLYDTESGEVLQVESYETTQFMLPTPDGVVLGAYGQVLDVELVDDRMVVTALPLEPEIDHARGRVMMHSAADGLVRVGDDGDDLVVYAVRPDGLEFLRRLPDGVIPRYAQDGARGPVLYGHDGVRICDLDVTRCEPVVVPGIVIRALWSEAGDRMLLMTTTGEAYTYEPASGRLLLMDRGAAGGVIDVERLSGDRVAVLDASGKVEVYDSQGSLLDEIDTSDLGPRDLAADGEQVWVVGARGMRRWRIESVGHPVTRRLPNGVGALTSGDDAVFVAHDSEVYRVRDDGLEHVFTAPSFVKSLAYHDARLLVGTVRSAVWELAGGEARNVGGTGARRVGFHEGPVWLSMAGVLWLDGAPTAWEGWGDLAVGGGRVALSTERGVLSVVDLAQGSLAWQEPVGAEVWALALSADGQQLAYALDDHQVRSVDLRTGETRLMPGRHRSFIAVLEFSPSGHRLASGSWDGTAQVWSAGSLEAALEAHDGRISALTFPSDDVLYTGSWDKTVRRWDLTAWERLVSESAQAP